MKNAVYSFSTWTNITPNCRIKFIVVIWVWHHISQTLVTKWNISHIKEPTFSEFTTLRKLILFVYVNAKKSIFQQDITSLFTKISTLLSKLNWKFYIYMFLRQWKIFSTDSITNGKWKFYIALVLLINERK